MKNTLLRILIGPILFSLISGVVVTIIGVILGWKTPSQFSNGLFWAGTIIFGIGGVNALGRLRQPAEPYSQSTFYLDRDQRFKLMAADTYHGNNLLAFLGVSGLLLFGMSSLAILVGGLF